MARAAALNFVSASSSSSDRVSRRCIAASALFCSMRTCRCLAIGEPVYVAPMAHRVLIGCSGWQYKDWRGVLYPDRCPQRRWLEVYSQSFPTVEVNSSFYRLPKRDAVARWTQQVPGGFVFTVKVSRYITHIKRLTDVADGMRIFGERIEPIAERGCLGPLLWQLPPNFKRDDERLAGALAALPPPTGDFAFVRFHWGARGRRGNYSDSELAEWAGRVQDLARDREVFVYFNNDWEGFAVHNAVKLERLLAAG